nr:MAG TPA: hypothetical protein [Caudoviricetes sp.]
MSPLFGSIWIKNLLALRVFTKINKEDVTIRNIRAA